MIFAKKVKLLQAKNIFSIIEKKKKNFSFMILSIKIYLKKKKRREGV